MSNLLSGSQSPQQVDANAGGEVTTAPAGSSLPPSPTGIASAAAAGIKDTTDFECPQTTVRPGSATLTIGDKPNAPPTTPLDLKYQGNISNIARECHYRAGIITMKVGIEGRIITGPAGGQATQLDVPMRIAVVREGPDPKTVVSKFAQVQVSITDASIGVPFTYIDPDVSFPVPQPASEIDSYVVYVGFDPAGAPQKKQAPAPRTKKKPKPKS